MTDAGGLATFTLLSFVLIVVPGPSVLFVLARPLAGAWAVWGWSAGRPWSGSAYTWP